MKHRVIAYLKEQGATEIHELEDGSASVIWKRVTFNLPADANEHEASRKLNQVESHLVKTQHAA